MMNDDQHIAAAIQTELASFLYRINELCERIENKRTLDPAEREILDLRLATLKRDLDQAAKRGKVAGNEGSQTELESAFLEPAVRAASANLRVRVKSHPIRSGWYDNLHGVRLDIEHLLHQLLNEYPELSAGSADCA